MKDKQEGKGKSAVPAVVKRKIIKKTIIRQNQFLKEVLEGKSQTQAYMNVYGSRNISTAKSKASKLWKRIQAQSQLTKGDNKDLTQTTKVHSPLPAFEQALHDKGITDEQLADKFKNMLVAKDSKGNINWWAVKHALEMILKVKGLFKQQIEITHINPASSKEVARELFTMFENSGYLELIKKSVKVFESGGSVEDVSFTVEGQAQNEPTDTIDKVDKVA